MEVRVTFDANKPILLMSNGQPAVPEIGASYYEAVNSDFFWGVSDEPPPQPDAIVEG